MPLLESGEVEWDRTLAQQIADSYFIDSDSLIWDRHGNQWMVWRVGELEQWWLAFERIAGGSLSRKLLHSATD